MKLFSKHSKPTTAVAVCYQIGWWAHQHLLVIDAFEVDILRSELNLMNSISQISYTVRGVLKSDSIYVPYIQKVHHCEEIINTSATLDDQKENNTVDARISITPIVAIKNKKRVGEEREIPFEFTNQYLVKSLHWGENSIQFTCGNYSRTIYLQQTK